MAPHIRQTYFLFFTETQASRQQQLLFELIYCYFFNWDVKGRSFNSD